jgi:hypothetical protein
MQITGEEKIIGFYSRIQRMIIVAFDAIGQIDIQETTMVARIFVVSEIR